MPQRYPHARSSTAKFREEQNSLSLLRLLVVWAASMATFVPGLAVEQATHDAWTFMMEGETVAYVRQENGDWFFIRPGKPYNVLTEIERSQTEVVLQNVKTQLFIKLTVDQAYWRQPKQENWTPYFKGAFSKPPQSLLDQVSGDTKKMMPDVTKSERIDKPSEVTESGGDTQDYRVHVGYFVPSDRQPVANWEQKIRVIAYFVDSMYRNDLKLKGFDTPGLQWETENDMVKVHLIRGTEKADHYANHPTFNNDVENLAVVIPQCLMNHVDVLGKLHVALTSPTQ